MSEVIDRAVQQLGYTATKEHQRTVVEGLVGGKDVLGILPTGYGNSLCYAWFLIGRKQIVSILDSTSNIFTATNAEKQILICYSCIHAGGCNAYTWIGALPYSYASDACGWARDLNGATRNARTKKSIGMGTVC